MDVSLVFSEIYVGPRLRLLAVYDPSLTREFC